MSARTSTFTAALVLGLWSAAPASAADVTAPAGTPAVVVGPGGACTACEVVPMAHTRMKTSSTEHPLLARHRPLPPKTVELCPGACFGYFPTQWRKWDEVCPYPYNPAGTDVTRPAIPLIPPATGTLPDPRPADLKKMKSMISPLHVPVTRIN